MMQQHDDPFFAQVQQKLYNLEVAPPASAYTGIQTKLASGGAASRWWLNTAMVTLAAGALISALVGANFHYDTAEGQTVQTAVEPLQAVLAVSHERILDREYDLKFEELDVVQEEEEELMAVVRKRLDRPAVARTSFTARPAVERAIEQAQATPQGSDPAEIIPAEPQIVATPVEPVQESQALPGDWAKRTDGVNASDILNQVDGDQEEIIITIPVKVTVEDED
jgi:hypothetical protein